MCVAARPWRHTEVGGQGQRKRWACPGWTFGGWAVTPSPGAASQTPGSGCEESSSAGGCWSRDMQLSACLVGLPCWGLNTLITPAGVKFGLCCYVFGVNKIPTRSTPSETSSWRGWVGGKQWLAGSVFPGGFGWCVLLPVFLSGCHIEMNEELWPHRWGAGPQSHSWKYSAWEGGCGFVKTISGLPCLGVFVGSGLKSVWETGAGRRKEALVPVSWLQFYCLKLRDVWLCFHHASQLFGELRKMKACLVLL